MPAPFAAKQTEAQEVAWVEDGPHSTGPSSSHPLLIARILIAAELIHGRMLSSDKD